jgi:hypothetical protein
MLESLPNYDNWKTEPDREPREEEDDIDAYDDWRDSLTDSLNR